LKEDIAKQKAHIEELKNKKAAAKAATEAAHKHREMW